MLIPNEMTGFAHESSQNNSKHDRTSSVFIFFHLSRKLEYAGLIFSDLLVAFFAFYLIRREVKLER